MASPSFKRNCLRVFPTADYVFQGRPNIRDILTEGQEVIVQVTIVRTLIKVRSGARKRRNLGLFLKSRYMAN